MCVCVCISDDFAGDMLFDKQSIAMLASQFSFSNGSQCTQKHPVTTLPFSLCE